MMHKIGERISVQRKNRNMSQEELAAVLNVSRQTISKWETGDTLPDVYNCVALAKMFHMSLDQFIMGSASKYSGNSYISQLKDKRRKINIRSIIVGAIGSTAFALSVVLTDAMEVQKPTVGIIFAFVLPVLMLCWGYAIWGFIQISRIGQELKYLEKIELMNLTEKNKE